MSNKDIKSQLYTFKAKCVRVIDGDTIEIDLDLGMRIKKEKEKVLHDSKEN